MKAVGYKKSLPIEDAQSLFDFEAAKPEPKGRDVRVAVKAISANPGFNMAKDFAPIALVTEVKVVLVVHPSTGVKSVKELIALAKAKDGGLLYASVGPGSAPHLAAELFLRMTGTKMVHVPYNGGAPAAVGVMSNQVQALFSSVVTVLSMVQGGTLRAIAIASERRSPLLPDVPTFA